MSRFYHCSEIAEHRETDFNCFDRQAGVKLTETDRGRQKDRLEQKGKRRKN